MCKINASLTNIYSAVVPKNCLILDLATSAEKKEQSQSVMLSQMSALMKNFYTTASTEGSGDTLLQLSIVYIKSFFHSSTIVVWDSRVGTTRNIRRVDSRLSQEEFERTSDE